MKKQLKTVPEFTTEEEERRFWELNDSSEYVGWKAAQQVVLPNLKPTSGESTTNPEGPVLAERRATGSSP